MGPFGLAGGDSLAFTALFLFAWLLPRLLLRGVPSPAFARQSSRRLQLGSYAEARLEANRSPMVKRGKGGPSRAA